VPQTPYARLLVSVNGGPPQTGGIEVTYGNSIGLYAESTVGWGIPAAVWQITTYPPGWPVPPGWSVDPVSNTYFIAANVSALPPFVLPASSTNLWGKWKLRLLVNGGGGALTDASTSLEIVSPHGLHDLAPGEGSEFGDERSWIGPHQENLRLLDGAVGVAQGTVASVNVTPPITNTGTPTAPVLGIAPVTEAAAGAMLPADKAKLDNATSAATPSTLVARDATGNSSFNAVFIVSGYFVPAQGVFSLLQVQATSGVGKPASVRAQMGAAGASGGSLTLGGGDAGTPGQANTFAGSTLIQLGAPDAATLRSAPLQLLAGPTGAFLSVACVGTTAVFSAPSALMWAVAANALELDATGIYLTTPLVGWRNAAAAPTANPPSGVDVYAFGSALYARSQNGVLTTLAAVGTPGGTSKISDRIDVHLQTQNNAETLLFSYPLPVNSTGQFTLDLVAHNLASGARGWVSRKFRVSGGSGTAQVRPSNQVPIPDDDATGGSKVTASVAGNDLVVYVTGVTGTTLQWRATGTVELFVP
jgi:hypothetical protein